MSRSERLRVLHIATRFSSGGSEQRILDSLHAAPDAEVLLITGPGSDFSGIPVGRLRTAQCDSLVRDLSPGRDLKALIAIWRLIRDYGPFDVVHTHQSKAGVIGRLASILARSDSLKIHSYSMANFGEGYTRVRSAVFRTIEVALSRRTDGYAVVGEDLRNRLAQAGIPRGKMEVVRSGIDLKPFLQAPKRGNASALTRRRADLLFVGALSERKGAHRLPEIARLAQQATGLPVTLVVAGAGECSPVAVPGEHSIGTSTLLYLGYTPAIAELMTEADLLVLPTSAEGLPQVLVQAAAASLPFVSYRVDGVAELLNHGAQGIAVDPGDEAALVKAIGQTLAEGPAPITCDRSFFETWNRDVIDAQYQRLYQLESNPD